MIWADPRMRYYYDSFKVFKCVKLQVKMLKVKLQCQNPSSVCGHNVCHIPSDILKKVVESITKHRRGNIIGIKGLELVKVYRT